WCSVCSPATVCAGRGGWARCGCTRAPTASAGASARAAGPGTRRTGGTPSTPRDPGTGRAGDGSRAA
ncbi:MAG: hypothetical protein AVDCRST_MAG66-3511, partial [uncultured Pseudonocardia sp.]